MQHAAMIVASALTLLPAFAGLRAQSPPPSSAPLSDVRYDITFDSTTAAANLLGVQMTFQTGGTDPVVLSLPAWTPGAYELSFFARKVERFTATAGERPLRWDKLDYDTWRIDPAGARDVTVRFDYVANTLDNAMAWSSADFLLVNGTNIFLYPEGRPFDFAARVTVHTDPAWRVATGMTSANGANQFTASNYHDLVDMPLFVGRMDLDSNLIDGKWYRLASYPPGAFSGSSRKAFWGEIREFMPPLIAVTGEAPWDAYTVMMIFDPESPGGSALEHQNSHVGVYTPAIIGNPLLASISAHEVFHAWNVKRLRPADMVPYDYSRPQPTPLLWVSEGITDYYADLALVRGDVVPPALFYQLTNGKINEVAAAPATALEDASLTSWIHPVDGSADLYYPKGSLAGLLLDILIRDASDNRASLDVVLHDLYHSVYKSGKGFTVADWWQAVSRAAGGKSFDEFSRRYIDGREPFPYGAVFPLGGFRADSTPIPRLGTTTVVDSLGVQVTSVVPGSAADAAGVRIGDRLVRVGDIDVQDQSFGAMFRARYANRAAGSPLPIVLRRAGQAVTLNGELRFADSPTYSISLDPNASPKAARIREGILKGTLSR